MKSRATRKAKPVRPKRSKMSSRKRRASAKATPRDTIDALVAANAQALGLTLDPAWHGGIAFNLRLILRLAAQVDGFALPDDTEPAPIFHA
jgi:hypothetical protein